MDIEYEAEPKYDSGFRHCGTGCYETGQLAFESDKNNLFKERYLYDVRKIFSLYDPLPPCHI